MNRGVSDLSRKQNNYFSTLLKIVLFSLRKGGAVKLVLTLLLNLQDNWSWRPHDTGGLIKNHSERNNNYFRGH